jgi:hypothetical protein
MKRINSMDMNNTPFEVPAGMIGKKDVVANVPNNFSSATGVNAEKIARQLNAGATKVLSKINKLKAEIDAIPIDEELGMVTLDLEILQSIQQLTESVYISFEELLKIGR